MLDFGPIDHHFVRRFRRPGLEKQAELRVGRAAEIDGKHHRFGSPAAMIAGQGGERRQRRKHKEARHDERFLAEMSEGHDKCG